MLLEHDFHAEGSLDTKGFTDEGDLIMEGWAAVLGPDDQDEAFESKALEDAITDFMARDRPLLYHHRGDMLLGNVEHLEMRGPDAKGHPGGLWGRYRLIKPEPGTEAADIFQKAARGALRGLSVAGRFFRRPVEVEGAKAGESEHWRIWKSRLREISLTPVPVHPLALAEVAQKAFEDAESAETEPALGALDEAAAQRISGIIKRYTEVMARIEAALARDVL